MGQIRMIRSTPPSADPARVSTHGRTTDWPGIVACAAVALLVLGLSWFKLSSLDIGYHLAYGRHFLETGNIVGRNANWGSQVVMSLAERWAGASGLIALRLMLIAVIFASIAAIVRQYVSSWLTVAIAWMLAAMAAYERFSLRPELFSYAVMALQLMLLARGLKTWRSITALALLQLAWVNLHSYFLVGLALTGAWFAESALRWAWAGRTDRTPNPDLSRRFNCIAVALLVQIAVCFINPRHVEGATFPLHTLAFLQSEQVMGGAAGGPSTSAWSEISEFQSPFSFLDDVINARTIHAYLFLLVVVFMGGIALLVRGRIDAVLLIVLLFVASVLMRRNIAPFAIAAAPLSLAGIAVFVPWSKLHASLRRTMRYLAVVLLVTLSCWWIAGIAGGRFYYVERRVSREFGAGYSERTFPRRAVEWLATQDDLKPNLFVDYFASSNTLQWLPPRFKLFVDTNTFAYEQDTLRTAFSLGLGEIPHNPFFETYGVNIILLHCGPDTQLLVGNLIRDDGEWALVYFDQSSVIFVRRISEHVDVIRHNRLSPSSLNAEAWITPVIGGDPAKALALGTIINVPMSLGWSKPAARIAKQARTLAPDYHEAWHYEGVCHGNLGNAAARAGDYDKARREWNEAIACFKRTLKLAPDHAEANQYLEGTRQKLDLMKRQ